MRAGAQRAEPESFFPGSGPYRCVRKVRGTATSIVWEAVCEQRRFAIKTVDRAADSRALHALRHEFELGRSLDHPHIVAPLQWLEAESGAAIVFPYLPNGDLAGLAGFAPAAWSGALLTLCDALRYLHARGFVHLDLKARNVMFDAADRPVLIDLGSARPAGSPLPAAGTTARAYRAAGAAVADSGQDWSAFAELLLDLLRTGPEAAAAGRADEPLAAAAEDVWNEPSRIGKLRALERVLKLLAAQTKAC